MSNRKGYLHFILTLLLRPVKKVFMRHSSFRFRRHGHSSSEQEGSGVGRSVSDKATVTAESSVYRVKPASVQPEQTEQPASRPMQQPEPFREQKPVADVSRLSTLLSLKTFLYLLAATLLLLFQISNNLAIVSLAKENEKILKEIRMMKSVTTAQELKINELHGIHNITVDAARLGLTPSLVPPAELYP